MGLFVNNVSFGSSRSDAIHQGRQKIDAVILFVVKKVPLNRGNDSLAALLLQMSCLPVGRHLLCLLPLIQLPCPMFGALSFRGCIRRLIASQRD